MFYSWILLILKFPRLVLSDYLPFYSAFQLTMGSAKGRNKGVRTRLNNVNTE